MSQPMIALCLNGTIGLAMSEDDIVPLPIPLGVRFLMTLSPEVAVALREVIYHRLKAWDASTLAEKALGVDIDTSSEHLGYVLSSIGNPDDALQMSESELIDAFGLTD